MSQAAVEQVIGKLMIDREFRKKMAADINQALAGCDLTPGEREGFTHLDLSDFDKAVGGLDERVSKGLTAN